MTCKAFFIIGLLVLQVRTKAEEIESEIKLSVSANPSLPTKNLLLQLNPGFEKGLEKWRCDVAKHKKNGIQVKISNLAAKGEKSLYVNTKGAKKSLSLGWGKGNFHAIQYLKPEGIFKNGEQYIIACLARTAGGNNLFNGPGVTFYLPGWKHLPSNERMDARAIIRGPTNGKWKRFVSKPFTFSSKRKTFCSLSYQVVYERGEFWVDEIGMYPAFTKLSLKAESPYGIFQVTVTDDNKKQVYNSGKLKEKPKVFETTIKVFTTYTYKIRAMDYDGDLRMLEYPEKQQKEKIGD